jgi:hypothetical protein
VVFLFSATVSAASGVASLLRGPRYVHQDEGEEPARAPAPPEVVQAVEAGAAGG